MNDNLPPDILRQRFQDRSPGAWVAHIQEVRSIGVRALAKPESLTMGEIQDIAMGFLMAAGTLEKMAHAPV
ncbi:hypothetical protein P7D22_21875 [Lichenihabitans sp. Uapishka_5]|uniref:hypothetical protein n=1 Tax=Lichenihabitans sp. Uapishka_5 TaxID=3037302 RepID=UPI0029E82001|nr:hypothetical protein [Lichenihabitans sp. Uapishka_5]MDX7953816.1 hypothetical protein [Lichenihabitans sp. Uapishka_5]